MVEKLENYPLLKQVFQALEAQFKGSTSNSTFEKDELTLPIDKSNLIQVIEFLKNKLGFNALNDMVALDNLNTKKEGEKRFTILYLLYRFPEITRIRIRIDLDDNETVQTITGLYKAANWAEREIFDMFGLKFAGHPDLTRIYMPDEYTEFPLRKDFPLEGKTDGV